MSSVVAQLMDSHATGIGQNALYFEQFYVGQSWMTARRTVTETDVVMFSAMTGDHNPIHTDAEFAKTTAYGERLLHGPAGFTLAIGLESRLGIKEGTAIAFLGLTWDMRGPIVIGDTIHVRQAVSAVRATKKPGVGIVNFAVSLLNQRGEVVQDGEWKVMMHCRPQ
ncbi:MaoC/PaaZ C-terminal domain-containing protein [Pseudomonas putida]